MYVIAVRRELKPRRVIQTSTGSDDPLSSGHDPLEQAGNRDCTTGSDLDSLFVEVKAATPWIIEV
jgi:hypothetical protein